MFVASLAVRAAITGGSEDADGITPLTTGLLALSALPLAARRIAPLAVFVLTALASSLLSGVAGAGGPPLGATLALYWLAADTDGPRARTITVVALVAALLAVHAAAGGLARDAFPGTELLFGALLWGGAWLAGDRTRLRQERMEQILERARRAELDAERDRRLAAAEERTRIARDLHDSAGHAINVILVHAGLGRMRAQEGASDAGQEFETIEQVARETVGEIDQLVGVLRDALVRAGPRRCRAAARASPRSRRLSNATAQAGMEVTMDLHRDAHPLPAAVDRGAFRILQEALTNAARHGTGSARAEVAVDDACGRADRGQPRRARRSSAGRRRRARAGRDARAGGDPRRDARCAAGRLGVHGPGAAATGGERQMTEPAVRVLIVDDDDLMRAGLRGVLSSDEAIEVVGEESDGRHAVYRTRLTRPDVILMDVRMADLDGIAATREVLAEFPETKVVILTTFEEDDYIFGALSAGASGFLLKRTPPEELIAAIHTIAAGDSLLSPSVTSRVIERMARQPAPRGTNDARLEDLTDREREVLQLVARGLSNAEIAAELFIEESTVKTHVTRVLTKLDVRDRVQAVIFAYEHGLESRSDPAS